MMEKVKENFGVEKPEILQTAESQLHDHKTCKKMLIESCWIANRGATMGNKEGRCSIGSLAGSERRRML
ncbi:hypothetical protein BDZ45DRAFT_760380 [Acephala macrosclerotiorum]|nr:hypothetical protein BDZ45DRAFT_760380 [Acephala macrosclerotiorum]